MRTLSLLKLIKEYKNKKWCKCMKQRFSTKMMLHLTKPPSMQEHAYILQFQSLLLSFTLPYDTLLSHLLWYIRRSNILHNGTHSQSYFYGKKCLSHLESLDKRNLKKNPVEFRQNNLCQNRSSSNSTLLSQCPPIISLDPILWLPMTRIE